MSSKKLLRNAKIVNEGNIFISDVLISGERIEKIAPIISCREKVSEVDLSGNYLLPGCIDDQVHFREPGFTHKATIYSESRAAAAGGITSFMEMPNTIPNTLTQELLEEKYRRAANTSLVNFSFFMGVSNDNTEEVLKTNPSNVCGIKIFMGSSTGNMLVDNEATLTTLFSRTGSMLIATHCEDEFTIKKNSEFYKEKYGEEISVKYHSLIRSTEACYLSSSMAVSLAKKYGTRLHVLHISTEKELELFNTSRLSKEKLITSEACIHHLWFSEEDYTEKGNFIKWNPAVKTSKDRDALWKALHDNRIDVIATDHAPHTLQEKQMTYFKAPSGGPLVQDALPAMLEKVKEGKISIEKVVEKMAHAPALLFQVADRGYIREGYFADLVVVDPSKSRLVEKSTILYKCGWSPFEGTRFSSSVAHTFVNGNLVYSKGSIIENSHGKRLIFRR